MLITIDIQNNEGVEHEKFIEVLKAIREVGKRDEIEGKEKLYFFVNNDMIRIEKPVSDY